MSDTVIQGADAPPMPAPLESPSPEPKTYAEELEAAVADMGKEVKPEPVKEAVTQEKLSSGYAKLERQKRAVTKREAEIAAKEAEIGKLREDTDRTHGERSAALEARNAELAKLEKLLDEDEEAFLEAVAARRKTTSAEFYDKLTRRRLNGGVRAPEDMVADVRAEHEQTRKELEEIKAAKQAEVDAAKKADEERQKHEAWQRAVQSENQGFVNFLQTQAAKYPLMSEEKPEEVIAVARQIAGDRKVTYTEVADYIEQQLSFQKLKEEREAALTETPKKSAPEPKGKKAEPAKAKTITNSMATPRSVKSEGTPLTEQERHDRALAHWK